MNKNFFISLCAVLILCLIAYLGAKGPGGQYLFGVIIPGITVIIFIVGFIMKMLNWAKSPVPFRIPSTCGQQKSLPWIKPATFDNPFSQFGVFGRLILEAFFFRSLFRNTKISLHQGKDGNKIVYDWELFLWAGSLAFHYSFLMVVLRHMRFFMEPVPGFIKFLAMLDSFFRVEVITDAISIGLPAIMMTGVILFLAGLFLLARRMFSSQVSYISLVSDYFPLFLIIGIALTGILMRYFIKVDIVSVKALTMGLATFKPVVPEGIGSIFYIHLFLVSILLAYFPASKLMHMGGVFMSPTRNLTADTRMSRHVNPWNYDVKTHTYEEYEDEFREKMVNVGLPVDKPVEKKE